MRTIFIFLFILTAPLPFSGRASNYGTTGVLDIPNARMMKDGTFVTTIAVDTQMESYMLSYQALPWLQATYRYNGFKNQADLNWDRNYEVKIQLFDETINRPAIAFGIRDVVGTGVFGAEYLVASKQFDNWDVTLGLGWGNLAGEGMFDNPLSLFTDRFDTRDVSVGEGGTLQLDSFFSGPRVSILGGATYAFDQWPVTAKFEYNPNIYLTGQGSYVPTFAEKPYTVGLTWHAQPNLDISVSYRHLELWGFYIQSRFDTTVKFYPSPKPRFISSADLAQSKLPKGIRKSRWYDKLLYDIEKSQLFMISARTIKEEARAEIELSNPIYPNWQDALMQAHRLASVHLPNEINLIDYIIYVDGHRVQTVRLNRINTTVQKHRFDYVLESILMPARQIANPEHETKFFDGTVNLDLTLSNRLMLFDPDQPLSAQIFLKAATRISLPQDWQFNAAYRINIWHNFDNLTRFATSRLPSVRTDVLRYLRQGENGVEQLYFDKRGSTKVMPNLHYRVFAGVLETMYSGAGGELLYQPNQSRLAFGLSANYAKKRAFDGSLDHLDYDTYSGFASVYWATPFHDYDVAVHFGRYLANDYGATLQVRRTFNNGWQVGLWATKTNVSAEDFGEGSFDKGFFLRIPIHSISASKVRSFYQTRIRPIQRDGGARLEDFSGNLWWDLRDARYDVFTPTKH